MIAMLRLLSLPQMLIAGGVLVALSWFGIADPFNMILTKSEAKEQLLKANEDLSTCNARVYMLVRKSDEQHRQTDLANGRLILRQEEEGNIDEREQKTLQRIKSLDSGDWLFRTWSLPESSTE